MTGDGANAIVVHPADGSGEPTIVATRPVIPVPGSWHPDGETLAFHEINGMSNRDIWLVSGSSDPVPYLATPANERTPAFSSDGRFIAYVSDESGDWLFILNFARSLLETSSFKDASSFSKVFKSKRNGDVPRPTRTPKKNIQAATINKTRNRRVRLFLAIFKF